MKIGISRISSTPEQATEVVQTAADAGFDGVQIKTNQLNVWDFDHGRFVEACGETAALSRGGVVFHPGVDYTTWHEKTQRLLGFAKAAGAEHVCYCFCPPRDQEGSFHQAVRMLTETGKQYADAGIPFSLHNHTGSVFGDLADLKRAAEALDPAICGLTFDTAHAHNCGIRDLGGAVRKLTGFITNVHLKDARRDGSFCPVGEGVMDLPPIIDALRKADYNQWLIVDEESRDYETPQAYAISMRFLRSCGIGKK